MNPYNTNRCKPNIVYCVHLNAENRRGHHNKQLKIS
jgi:hypothetical protein